MAQLASIQCWNLRRNGTHILFPQYVGFDMNGTVKGFMTNRSTLAIKHTSRTAACPVYSSPSSTAWGWQVNEGFLIVGEGEPGEYYPIQRSTGTLSSHTNLLKGSGANGIDFDPLVAAQGSNLRYFILSDGDFLSPFLVARWLRIRVI